MRPKRWPGGTGRLSVEWLADTLFDLAGDQDVRVIEALAAVLARQSRAAPAGPGTELRETPARRFTLEASEGDSIGRRIICQRIARRALHGSLVDPTGGATAVHRIHDSPAWSRDLLPIGMFGPFLFYRPPPRWQAGDRPADRGSSRQYVFSPDRQDLFTAADRGSGAIRCRHSRLFPPRS
jgi:hypothetical protein